jgi:hypothetical protein
MTKEQKYWYQFGRKMVMQHAIAIGHADTIALERGMIGALNQLPIARSLMAETVHQMVLSVRRPLITREVVGEHVDIPKAVANIRAGETK